MEFFVGGVQIVIRKAETHHDARQTKVPVEIANDGDGPAGADEDRVLAPDFM